MEQDGSLLNKIFGRCAFTLCHGTNEETEEVISEQLQLLPKVTARRENLKEDKEEGEIDWSRHTVRTYPPSSVRNHTPGLVISNTERRGSNNVETVETNVAGNMGPLRVTNIPTKPCQGDVVDLGSSNVELTPVTYDKLPGTGAVRSSPSNSISSSPGGSLAPPSPATARSTMPQPPQSPNSPQLSPQLSPQMPPQSLHSMHSLQSPQQPQLSELSSQFTAMRSLSSPVTPPLTQFGSAFTSTPRSVAAAAMSPLITTTAKASQQSLETATSQRFSTFPWWNSFEFEAALDNVLELCAKEHLLDAHHHYMKLVADLDTALIQGKFRLYGVFRPAGWLRDRGSISVLVPPKFKENQIQQHVLTRAMSTAIKRSGTIRESIRESINVTPIATLNALVESFQVIPLRSQADRQLDLDGNGFAKVPAQTLTDVVSIFQDQIYDDPQDRYNLGREPITQRVFVLGEMPSTVFGIGDNEESLAVSTDADRAKDPSLRYNYKNRESGGISLPIDIQILLDPLNESDKKRPESAFLEIHKFFETLVNNAQIQKLRLQISQALKTSMLLENDQTYTSDKQCQTVTFKGQQLRWRMLPSGDAFSLITGSLDGPILESLTLVNESDQYNRWIPFLGECGKLHQVSRFAQLIRLRHSLPWPLDDRETVLLGYAVDLLNVSNPPSVLMNAVSVPDTATSVLGLPVKPPTQGLTRLHLKFFTFQLFPNAEDPNHTKCRFLVFMNPQIDFVPKTVQGFIAKQSANRMFSSIKKLTGSFKGSIYEKRIRENRYVYALLEERLRGFYGPNIKMA